jgi:hypothetical protein
MGVVRCAVVLAALGCSSVDDFAAGHRSPRVASAAGADIAPLDETDLVDWRCRVTWADQRTWDRYLEQRKKAAFCGMCVRQPKQYTDERTVPSPGYTREDLAIRQWWVSWRAERLVSERAGWGWGRWIVSGPRCWPVPNDNGR